MSDNSSRTDLSRDDPTLRDLDLRVPPFPRTLPRVLELLHEPGFTDPEDLTEIVQHDPAATARLLKQINSAYYGLHRSVTDVGRAIRMMGTTTAAGSVVSLGMLRMDELADGPVEACFQRFIRHSEATGLLASSLLGPLSPESAGPSSGLSEDATRGKGFAEGLLHDFGKLVLFYNYPEKSAALYEEKRFAGHLQETDDRKLERFVFGCDHCQAGAYAALELNFPSALIDVTRHHHDLEEASDPAVEPVLWAVRAANLATKAMGGPLAGAKPLGENMSWERCAEQPVWQHWNPDPEADGPPPHLMERLQAKKETVMLFTDFFVAQSDAESADQLPPNAPLVA
ncbi:HDOD domain-containing protein [Salinibacter ruber]|uniref:HDOD domain-containing protein n=1 Tax=Salinibacter ruber TaxID=146919 RepID=UPI00160F3237|nr:HDOD domain-containing protein [Salinibacter ruber]MBB4090312.1 HD-like signal output (HDOD) protein [Salinibacter ruber]